MNSSDENQFTNLEDAIQELLPEIQLTVKEQLFKQIQDELSEQIQQQIAEIQNKAEEQYLEAKADLEREAVQLKIEQTSAIRGQIQTIKADNQRSRGHKLSQLQERFISENFHEKIMGHEKIKNLEIELFDELMQMYEPKFSQNKERRERELLIKIQNREQKDRRQKDKAIKKRVYNNMSTSTGIEDLTKDIETLKIGIGSMRSEFNIKVKKVEDEIRDYRKKIKERQSKENLEKLREELEELKRKKQVENLLKNSCEEQYSRNFSHLDSSGDNLSLFKNQMYNMEMLKNSQDIKFINQDNFVIDSEGEEDSDDPSKYLKYDQIHKNCGNNEEDPTTFQGTAEASPSPQQQYEEYSQYSDQNCSENQEDKKILGIDVCRLLRANWQADPLSHYITSDKENNINISNPSIEIAAQKPQKSSFHEKYMLYLQNLNKKSRFPPQKPNPNTTRTHSCKNRLSNNTKQTIIRKIGMMNMIH